MYSGWIYANKSAHGENKMLSGVLSHVLEVVKLRRKKSPNFLSYTFLLISLKRKVFHSQHNFILSSSFFSILSPVFWHIFWHILWGTEYILKAVRVVFEHQAFPGKLSRDRRSISNVKVFFLHCPVHQKRTMLRWGD